MSFEIHTIRLPDDYTPIAALLNHILSEPTKAEYLAEEDSKIPSPGKLSKDELGRLTGFDRYRVVAVNEEGDLLGYAISWRAPWTAPGELNHMLIVDPIMRNQGIGSKLYEAIEHWAKSAGASKLNFEVPDNAPESIQFAKHRGFEIQRHYFESVLDLSQYDQPILVHLNEAIIITPYSEVSSPDIDQKLYELYRETSFDIPGFSGDYFDYAEWRKWTLDLPGSKPEYVLLAMDEEKPVGVTQLLYNESTQSMYFEYTGVRKAYRGKGIGLALKAKSIELAQKLQVKVMRTNNDSLNAPMLRINRDKMGFEPVPGYYHIVKTL